MCCYLLLWIVRNRPRQRHQNLFRRNSRLLLRRLIQLPLHTLFFLHLALFHPLHFFLPFLKCRCHSVSSQALPGAAQTVAVKLHLAFRYRLPARFAGLPRRFAVVLIRKPFAPAASAFAAASATTAAPIRPAKIPWPAGRTAFALRPRFIHLQIPSAQLFPVESSHGLGRFVIVGHFHKRKPPRPPGFPVHRHVHARHLPKRREQIAQLALGGLKVHIPDKQTLHLNSP